MTPRSPGHHSKTTTFSRRLRNRADQNISLPQLEIRHIRSARPRRVATLHPSRHGTVNYRPQDTNTPLLVWTNASISSDNKPTHALESSNLGQTQPDHNLLAPILDFAAYTTSQTSNLELASPSVLQASASPDSILSSASTKHHLGLPLSIHPRQTFPNSVDLREMK